MKLKITLPLVVLQASASLLAAQELAYRNPSLPVESRVRDLIGRMTLEEKARQLDMFTGVKSILRPEDFDFAPHSRLGVNDIRTVDAEGIPANPTHAKPGARLDEEKAAKVLGDLGVGCLHDVYARPKLANQIQAWVIKSNRLGIPALVFEEGLHGYMSFDQTLFPQSINLASTWNRELAQKSGAAIATEARANGVHMILGPVLDLARDPRWGRSEETFGEDPFLTGQLGLEFVRGMQGESLASNHTCIAEPKHFAGHGSPESGLNTSPAHYGEREMRSLMLKSFEPAIREGGAMGVMAAYHDIDGVPVTANPWLLKQVLRDEWGFQGLVVADAGAIRRLKEVHFVAATPQEAVRLAINSGVNVQFLDYDNSEYQAALVEGVKTGEVSRATLDAAVSSILRAKFMLGLFEQPFVDETLDAKVRRSSAHLGLSLEVARQSMTLLKNQDGLLPLEKGLAAIAVIGPNGNSSRNGDYSEYALETKEGGLVECLKKAGGPKTKVLFSEGVDIEEAVAMANKASVVILALGERQGISGENFDRAELGLPGNQQALMEAIMKTGKPVVLVLMNGRALALPWAAEHVPAILEAWYPGEFGGQAIAETLLGKNNPAGRLTISFPKNVGQIPVCYNHFPSKHKKFVETDGAPQFVFGHGLSYTTFKYDHLEIVAPGAGSKGDVQVSFDLTNTGSRDGDEVAQVYLRQTTASVATPEKALKGFARVHLSAGETKSIKIRLKQSDLAVWGANRAWQVESGEYTVTAGGNSAAVLSAKFTLP